MLTAGQVMVFFSSCAAVKYHAELLNYVDLPVSDIHGKQKQARRTTTFNDFCSATSGVCRATAWSSSRLIGATRPQLHVCLPLLMNPLTSR